MPSLVHCKITVFHSSNHFGYSLSYFSRTRHSSIDSCPRARKKLEYRVVHIVCNTSCMHALLLPAIFVQLTKSNLTTLCISTNYIHNYIRQDKSEGIHHSLLHFEHPIQITSPYVTSKNTSEDETKRRRQQHTNLLCCYS
jgi:hypothetical protein